MPLSLANETIMKRIIIATIVLVLGCFAASLAHADVYSDLARCTHESDNANRLDCFDAIAKRYSQPSAQDDSSTKPKTSAVPLLNKTTNSTSGTSASFAPSKKQSPAPYVAPSTSYSGSSTCYTGPRGGRYTITKSGKKRYGC